MGFVAPLSRGDALLLSAMTLAFVGDAVHSLYVRCLLTKQVDGKPLTMHSLASDKVRASAQAALAEKWLNSFTEDELSVYHRARNGSLHHRAKNQKSADYRKATGFEAVLGYLYLTGQQERLQQILSTQSYEN